MKKVFVIAGPTASGKTALGIELARHIGGEIVSADSMQIYRGMDIGTAKATPDEQSAVVHHMLDVADPQENYSVARFVDSASACCDRLIESGTVPVIVGGTGLYIDSLLSGREFADSEAPELRNSLSEQYELLGGDAMLEKLRAVDPSRASLLSPNDRKRIIRALEIYELTGITATEHDELSRTVPPRYSAIRIVLGYRDRERLYSAINSRVDKMMSAGLTDEVKGLVDAGLSTDCTSMQAIGYKEIAAYLRGDISEPEAVELIKLRSRRYAKRQITWFGRWKDAIRIYWDESADISYAMEYLRTNGVV